MSYISVQQSRRETKKKKNRTSTHSARLERKRKMRKEGEKKESSNDLDIDGQKGRTGGVGRLRDPPSRVINPSHAQLATLSNFNFVAQVETQDPGKGLRNDDEQVMGLHKTLRYG